MNKTRRTSLPGKLAIASIWLVLLGCLSAVGGEYYLRKKAEAAARRPPRPVYDRLEAAYRPFTIQHVHPNYLFFFPFDPAERVTLGNEVATLSREGFRGPPPEARGGRDLAFLLGGSAAFGHFASHDSTTIAGWLNRLQERYFFVNAGVPSWNSTQELYRLASQILEYRPSLVIAYDGTNDVIALLDWYDRGLDYPPGTPESFHYLNALVGDIRSGSLKPGVRPWYRKYFPHLTRRLRAAFGKETPILPGGPDLPDVIDAAARKYAWNLTLMNDLATARGARFAAFFQPRRALHRHVPEAFRRGREPFEAFHDLVFSRYRPAIEYHDFSDLFDGLFDPVPIFEGRPGEDLLPEHVFVDVVHLSDRGNRLAAGEILKRLAP